MSIFARGLGAIDAVFPVIKPSGLTSADVVAAIKKSIVKQAILAAKHKEGPPVKGRNQQFKVGHGGTLDMAAEGILVIGVGKGCKQLHHFLKGTKEYEATGVLGKETPSLDADTDVTKVMPFEHITEDQLQSVCRKYKGEISQIPPLYSALKVGGKRASDLVREGEQVTLQTRQVMIHSCTVQSFQPPEFSIRVSCDGGTYVRSLIRDISRDLDTVGYMTHLTRTKQGPFSIDHDLVVKPNRGGKYSGKQVVAVMMHHLLH